MTKVWSQWELLICCGLFTGCSGARNDTALGRLQEHLISWEKYDDRIIPQMDKDHTLNLAIGVTMHHISGLYKTGILTCQVFLTMMWNDFRLQWDEADFDGISEVRLDNWNIWVPDIEILNLEGHNSIKNVPGTDTLITPNGGVLFMPQFPITVICSNFSYTAWPQGEQECNIKIGSRTYDGQILNLNLYNNKDEMDLSDFEMSSPWLVTEQLGNAFNEMYDNSEELQQHINFRFKVSRHPDSNWSDPVSDKLSYLVGLTVTLMVLLVLLLAAKVVFLLKETGVKSLDMMHLANYFNK